VAELGGSWDRWEQELDMRRLKALQEQFRRHPPVQSMVQAYLEIEPADEPPTDQSDEEIEAEIDQLMASGLVA
jgi:hypothetical protein